MRDFRDDVRAAVAGLSLDPGREASIVEELSQHMGDRMEELAARGASLEDASRAVRDELATGALASELARLTRPLPRRPAPAPGQEARGGFFGGALRDLSYAARQLRLNPAFTAVAVLSLALGTGANTAIFQLIDAVRLRALPLARPQELAVVRIGTKGPRTGWFSGRAPDLTRGLWERLAERQQGFASFAAWSTEGMDLSKGGESRLANVLWTSGGFFDSVGVKPQIGRLLGPGDDRKGCGSAPVVLSDAFWRRELGASPAVLGRVLSLDGHPAVIAGVTQPGFFGVEVGRTFDAALPVCAEPLFNAERSRASDPQAWWLGAIGRLKPGWTVEKATAQLATISRGLFEETLPPGYDAVDAKGYLGFKLAAFSAATGVPTSLRRDYERPLWLLMGISALVLLIACANLANLMLARASARQREMAVRVALGASRGMLVRQLLAESLLLAAIGAAAGVAIAQLLSRSLVGFLSTQSTRLSLDLGLDLHVLLFTAVLAIGTCLLFGLTPALQASRTSPREALQASARGVSGGSRGFGLRRALVVSQVALSLVLVVGALLFVGTLRNLVSLDAGFARESVLVARVDLTPSHPAPALREPARQALIERLRAVPGVAAAAAVDIVPLSGNGWNENIRTDAAPDSERQIVNFNRVGPGYFGAMGTSLLAGRDFDAHDTLGAPPVAVVTEMFVKKYLGGGNPVGRTLSQVQQGGKPPLVFRIVGLVKDVKYYELREDFQPIVFLAAAQDDEPGTVVSAVIRTTLPPAEAVASLKRAVMEANPSALLGFQTFDAIVREALVRERLMATLAGFFGLLAAVLAMVGLYGVISYMVARRRNEIGVRMALGAERRDIVRMVMREAGGLLGAGVAVGTVLAIAGASAARALLYGLSPGDPRTLAAAVAGLCAVAAAASILPARRAASVDPVQALRE